MTPETETKLPEPPASTGDGWCAWHQGNSRGVRLIQAIEQGSGPGGSLYACHPCRQAYSLVPLADQP